jgi:hypothetical protein
MLQDVGGQGDSFSEALNSAGQVAGAAGGKRDSEALAGEK